MFTGTLYPKQKEAAALLANKRRAMLAWEQGTGKTIISIAVVAKLFQLKKIKRVLIVVPPNITWQWEQKFHEFSDLKPKKVTREEHRDWDVREGDIYIVSYNLFRNDIESIIRTEWDFVLTDEAQEYRSVKSVTSKCLKRLNRTSKPTYRIPLTGTAISTKLEELYNILYVMEPGFLPPWPEFEKLHIVRNAFGAITDYKNLQPLHKYIQQRVDRKTHKDMEGELPKILPIVHTIEATDEYKAIQNNLLNALDDYVGNLEFTSEGEIKIGKGRSKVSRSFHEARQALQPPEKLDYAVKLIKRILEENPSNRIVIFNFYKAPIADLELRLQLEGVSCVRFTGDESSEEKQENVYWFKHSPDIRVLLCSNAGATGLDLPFANYLINLDIPLSYGLLDQRIKRITRVGSKFKSVVVHYLVMDDSIEMFFMNIVGLEERLAKAVLEGGEDEITIRPESLREFIRARG